MEEESSPTNELGVVQVDSLHESPTLDTVTHCNLNDLQSYLVNFNKEIEVNNDGSVSLQSCLTKVITPSSRPVFVTIPVSSESTTPEEEQLPVMSDLKQDKCLSGDDSIGRSLSSLSDRETPTDHMVYVEMSQKDSLSNTPTASVDELESAERKTSPGAFNDQGTEEGDSQLEGLGTDRIQLQELNLDPSVQFGLQNINTAEGMVMLPVSDVSSLLNSADPRLLQIVNINGQPTLQIVGGASLLTQQVPNTETPEVTEGGIHPGSVLVSSGSNELSLLATTSSSNNGLTSLLHTTQVRPADRTCTHMSAGQVVCLSRSLIHRVSFPKAEDTGPHLVAVQNDTENSGQVMSLDLDDIVPISVQTTQSKASPIQKVSTGYQSVALLPPGDTTNAQQPDVRYVLIVNPSADDKTQSQLVSLSNNLQGEVVEELAVENGQTKHFVKLGHMGKTVPREVILSSGSNAEIVMNAGEELSCNLCDYTSPQRYLMKRHMKSHVADRPHHCGLCDRSFKSMSSLQNHVNIHTGVRPHKCKMCESAFTTSGELVRHIRYKHTFEKPHKCTECEYASVELSKLKRHMRSHTGERPYACQYCSYASPDTYKLKRHMRIHTGEKPYQCDVCSAKFTQSNSLKAHKLIHSGNKPVFQCSLCPATCGRSSDLKVHVQKLHGVIDQPLICKKCNAKFPDRYSFKMHIKSHEGEKCFKCPECAYAAFNQRSLDTHMLTHSGIKPFECDDCDLAFRQKQLLKRHRYLYHNPVCSPTDRKNEACKECDKTILGKDNEKEIPLDQLKRLDEQKETSGGHTCGGCPKSLIEIAPLTADQLIANSLLADMKEGKLGTSPKVVVVHPDGRVEEVTAKLQNLSQSKPMDDFLVSLGVSGDSHFDQVSSLPGDVSVAEVSSLAEGSVLTGSEMVAVTVGDDDGEADQKANFVASVISVNDQLPTDVSSFQTEGSSSGNMISINVQKHLSEDSDEEVDVESLKVIEVPHRNLATVPHVVVNVVPTNHAENRGRKRGHEDESMASDVKQAKLSDV